MFEAGKVKLSINMPADSLRNTAYIPKIANNPVI
jgi:hypothetical protein